MADYTLSVKGEFQDEITNPLNSAKNALSGFVGGLKSAEGGVSVFGDMLKANLLSDAIFDGISQLKDGIVSIGKAAYSEGAALEQSLGGVETLFKDNADTVKKYAADAFKTAGLSANDYMEQVTSFSASLLQSLGGDTAATAEAANQAIIDMSDNANKMGTSMDRITDAYQGFAKQNYTMLDNLKLGYGGTKTEMERLLADAQELTGVEYDISNLADVYEAIHVIQTELGITGTTAKEAEQTLSGSFAAMSSAAKNVLGNLTLGEDLTDEVDALKDSVSTFADNLIPAVGNIISGLPTLVDGAVDIAADLAPRIGQAIQDNIGSVIDAGESLIMGVVTGIDAGLPDVIDGALDIIDGIGSTITDDASTLTKSGVNIMSTLAEGLIRGNTLISDTFLDISSEIASSLAQVDWDETFAGITDAITDAYSGYRISGIASQFGEIIASLGTAVTNALPALLGSGTEIISAIASGISESMPTIISTAQTFVATVASTIATNLPTLINSGRSLLSTVISGVQENLPLLMGVGQNIISYAVSGIQEGLPTLLSTAQSLATSIISGVTEMLPGVLDTGVSVVSSLMEGCLGKLPDVITTAGEMVVTFADSVLAALPDLLEAGATAGLELIQSLASSIIENLPEIAGAAAEVVANLLATIGEHLPDILSTGITLIGELAAGIIEAIPDLVASIPDVIGSIVDAFLGYDWLGLGADIIGGIGEGIKNAGGAIWDAISGAASDAWQGTKDFFGINSPSKLMRDTVGQYIPEGIAVGIEDGTPYLERSVQNMNDLVLSDVDGLTGNTSAASYTTNRSARTINYGGIYTNVYGSEGQSEERLAELVQEMLEQQLRQEEAVFA